MIEATPVKKVAKVYSDEQRERELMERVDIAHLQASKVVIACRRVYRANAALYNAKMRLSERLAEFDNETSF